MMARNGFNIPENPWDYVGNYRICLFFNGCFCEEDVWRMIMIINEEIEVIKGFVKPFIETLKLQNPRACAPPEK